MNRSIWILWMWRIGFLLLLFWLIPYSWALILALFTALLLNGIVDWLCKSFSMKRLWAVFIVFVLYVGSLTTLTFLLISVLTRQIITVSEKVPNIARELYQTVMLPFIKQWEQYSKTLPADTIWSIENAMERGIRSLEGFTQNFVQGTVQFVTSVPALFIDLLIYLIAVFLICLELPIIRERVKQFFRDSTYQKISFVYQDLSIAAVGFLKAQVLLSLLTFIMAYAGLWLLNVPYTLLLTLLIVIVDILPILGTGSVLVPWAIIVFFQGNQHLAIGLLLLFLVITIVRRTVEPKVYSANMGLTPLAALISLYLGFKLLGFIGLFVGPALVIVYETLKKVGVIKPNFKL